MFDSINTHILYEHERSMNKEFCIEYDKSSMAAKCDMLDRLVDQYFLRCDLASLINAQTPKKITTATSRIKRILRSILWNLLRAARFSDDCYLKISLRDISYRKSSTENPHQITREISKILTSLEKTEYLQRHAGFLDRKTGKSRMTRIRPTIPLLEDLKTIPADISEIYVEPEPIDIRKGYISTLDHASQQHMEEARTTISTYNEFMRSHDVTHPEENAGHLSFEDKNGDLRIVNITRKAVKAIYHADNEGVLSYGRIHGGMCQAIPARYRKFIRIDDEPTAELDYSAQVIHIVAGLEGISLTGDPYNIQLPVAEIDPELSREMVKLATMIMMNASDRKSLYRGFRGHFKNDLRLHRLKLRLTNLFIEQIVDAVLNTHPFLKSYAMKGMGKQIFMYDSSLARNIIQTFLDANKVILPIHDGFVVKQRDRNFLEETMKHVWFAAFRTTIPIKAEC